MNRRIATVGGMIVVLCAWLLSTAQETLPLRIREVVIVPQGHLSMTEEAIRAHLKSRAGSVYSPEAVHDDVQALYATERFSDVRIDVQPISETELRLLVYLREKPILSEIVIEGAKAVKPSEIRSFIDLSPGAPLDESEIFQGLEAAKEKYRKRGFPNAKLDFDTAVDPDTGRAVVRITVKEGSRVKISKVRFEGNAALSARELRKVMKTRPHHIFSWLTGSGRYMPEQLDADLRAVRELYRNKGYVDVELGEPDLEIVPGGKMIITIPVEEGSRYKVGSVEIEGNTLFETDKLKAILRMGPGETYSPPGERKDRDALRDYYESRGYLGTGVMVRRIPNTETGRIDLVYRIREGVLTTIDLIEIRGNTPTKGKVIRRELAVRPGELYDGPRVRVSEQRLRNLGFFDSVESYTEATEDPARRRLVFDVEEGKTGQMMFGAGFSSIDKLVGFAEVRQSNFDLFNPPYFRGAGQKLRLRVQIGTERDDLLLSFDEPWFMDRKLSLGTDLYMQSARFLSDDYDERRTGGRIRLGKALYPFIRGELFYNYEVVDIFDVAEDASEQIKMEEGKRSVSMLGASIIQDTRDSPFRPTRGMRNVLAADLAGGFLGAETDLYRLKVNSDLLFSMPWHERHVLALLGRAGVVEEYGDSDRVPIFDRFFLGGANTLRGFDYRDVGPKDENGEPIGGRTMLMATVEYTIPLVSVFRGAVFYDIGMVWDPAWYADLGNLNSDAGLGIRMDLPIGPVRIDYAWPIQADEFNDNPNGRLNFSMGYRF